MDTFLTIQLVGTHVYVPQHYEFIIQKHRLSNMIITYLEQVGAECLGETAMRSSSPAPGYPLSSKGSAGLHCQCAYCSSSRYCRHLTRSHGLCYFCLQLQGCQWCYCGCRPLPLDLVPVSLVPLGPFVLVSPPLDSILSARVPVLPSSERDSLRFLLVPRFGGILR